MPIFSPISFLDINSRRDGTNKRMYDMDIVYVRKHKKNLDIDTRKKIQNVQHSHILMRTRVPCAPTVMSRQSDNPVT